MVLVPLQATHDQFLYSLLWDSYYMKQLILPFVLGDGLSPRFIIKRINSIQKLIVR